MTPMRAAAAVSDTQANPGRGRKADAATDGDFGAVLTDVTQDGTPVVAAAASSGKSRIAPVASQGSAPAVAEPLSIDAFFTQLAMTAPTAAGSKTSREDTSKKHADRPTSGSVPSAATDTAADVYDAASVVASTIAAASVVANTASSATDSAGTQPQGGGDPSQSGGKSSPAAGAPPILGRMTPTYATYAIGATPLQGDDPLPATAVETKPPSAATGTTPGDIVGAQTIPPPQVALVEIASHLAPARLRSLDPNQAARGVRASTDTGEGTANPAAAPTPAGAASAGPDAQGDAQDGDAEGWRVERHDLVVSPTFAVEATQAARGTPVQQIEDAVTTLAADIASPGTGATAVAPKLSPTRSLILHLAPATLGTITVRLHLAVGGLSVRLEVEKPATLGLISHSREALQAAIGATYTLDQLVIQGADAPPQPNAGSHDATRSDSGAPADQQAGNRHGGEDSSRQPARQPQREVRSSGGGRADGLFV